MKIYDISMTIKEDMKVYKNKKEKKPIITEEANYIKNNFYESSIKMNLHTGTHIDAPYHMINNKKITEDYNLEDFYTEAKVFDLTSCEEKISKEDIIDFKIKEDDFVLFKTKNSFEEEFNYNFIYLDKSAASYLSNLKVKGVGIDALGIERDQKGHPTHKILLEQNIIILEGVVLKNINPGEYKLIAFPLKIKDVEGCPVRAVLIEN